MGKWVPSIRHLGKTYHYHVHPIADSSKRWHRCNGSQRMTEPTKNHVQGINEPHGTNLSSLSCQLWAREYLERRTNPYLGFLLISRISHEVNVTLETPMMNIYTFHLHFWSDWHCEAHLKGSQTVETGTMNTMSDSMTCKGKSRIRTKPRSFDRSTWHLQWRHIECIERHGCRIHFTWSIIEGSHVVRLQAQRMWRSEGSGRSGGQEEEGAL